MHSPIGIGYAEYKKSEPVVIRNTDALLTFDNYPDILGIPSEENKDPQVFDIIMTSRR